MDHSKFDLKTFRETLKITQESLAEILGMSREMISRMETGKKPISRATKLMLDNYVRQLNLGSNANELMKSGSGVVHPQRPGIPLFNDVAAIGGLSLIANDQAIQYPTETVDPGGMFPGATAAIRHYGESMLEYPPGSILFLRPVAIPATFIWGQDYMIEFNEYRVTKRIQKSSKDGYVKGYSTNREKYEDGALVHQPIDIRIDDIRRVFIVLGHIRRNNI